MYFKEVLAMQQIQQHPYRGFTGLDRFVGRVVRNDPGLYLAWPAIWDDRFRPSLDVYETSDDLVVKATIPGVKPDGITVTLKQGILVIQGEAEEALEEKEERYYLRERRSGGFHRAISLPEGLEVKKAEATFEDGVLTVTLPRTEEAKPQEIKVKAIAK
jgi:HSP20 family protein